MFVEFRTPATHLVVTGLTCRGGPGTMYRVKATAPNYRPYAFLQLIEENRLNTGADDIEFWVKPGDVTGIRGPVFQDLPAGAARILTDAAMVSARPEDDDLVGKSGANLYDHLGSRRRAGFLNIVTKTAHGPTTGNCLPFIEGLLVCRQDRFFARVTAGFPEFLRQSPRFKSAPETLHDPLDGFELAEGSFKSRDAHANLQVTFMRERTTGDLAADIDIDEASGFEHGLEVIRNALLGTRTSPYAVREFLLAADPIGRSLDPGYRFLF
jgi:hypothetical protein